MATVHTQGVEAKVIPLPKPIRDRIAGTLTKIFLADVNDFLFRPDKAELMRNSLRERMASGSPFIVIAHSQGSMIAYDVLRTMKKADADVRLFVTIGSPLGLQEVRDVLELGPYGRPALPRLRRSMGQRGRSLDLVAARPELGDLFHQTGQITDKVRLFLNPDSPWHPHSGTAYSLPTKYAARFGRRFCFISTSRSIALPLCAIWCTTWNTQKP